MIILAILFYYSQKIKTMNQENIKLGKQSTISSDAKIYYLSHIEDSKFYVCRKQDGEEHLVCFTDRDSAMDFRCNAKIVEYVDVSCSNAGALPFSSFYLDGNIKGLENINE